MGKSLCWFEDASGEPLASKLKNPFVLIPTCLPGTTWFMYASNICVLLVDFFCNVKTMPSSRPRQNYYSGFSLQIPLCTLREIIILSLNLMERRCYYFSYCFLTLAWPKWNKTGSWPVIFPVIVYREWNILLKYYIS